MLKSRKLISSFLVPAVTALAISLPLPSASLAQADNSSASAVWEQFSGFDAESDVRVNHQPLDDFLRQTVLPVGRSKGKMGTQARQSTYTGSRIRSSTSASPSKYEGNRVLYHSFTEEHSQFLKAYKEGLERLSNRRPLREMNKDEQLAFWLNLYNVTVLDRVADEYPIQKLKSLRQSKRQTPFWGQKTVTVEGVSLSLVDIEQILFRNWDDPRVIYGLYQGSIGGPSLPNIAFTAENVWTLLNNNALEFVNSNRGVRAKGANSAEVSKMYDWALEAFGNSDHAIISHIIKYADAFHGDMTGLSSIKPKYYDWNIADLVGGTLHKGQHTQLGGILTAQGGQESGSGPSSLVSGTPVGIPSPTINNTGGEVFTYRGDMLGLYESFADRLSGEALSALPQPAILFLKEVMVHNDLPEGTPSVTVIDCEMEECEQVRELEEQPPVQPEPEPRPSGVVTD